MSTEPIKPEQEPVGPLGGIVRSTDLRGTLVNAFRDALAAASKAATLPSVDDAVHECRKALRRARATVRLIADTLGRDDLRDLERAIRDARRMLSPARDAAVAPHALAELTIDDELRSAATAIITSGEHPKPEQVRAMVADASARVAQLGDVVAAALPAHVEWDDLADGVAETYRKARRSLRKAKRSHSAFHAFRKRAKELTVQLELLAGGVDGKTEALRKAIDKLGDELGGTVDGIMLYEHLEARGGDGAPESLGHVLEAIDRELHGRIRAGRKQARELFDRPTRRFVKKVGKALKKDHAPSEPASESAEN